MDTLKMLTVVSLALSFTCLLAITGDNSTTTSAGTYTTTQPLLTDYRSENYTTGRSVNISCTNKTWSEMIYTTWEIPKDRNLCTIAAHIDKLPVDNCLNGKVLRRTTNGESYLHIPLFKDTDEGIYKCETAYVGTSYTAYITVSARVSPQISTRLDFRNGKREAVCSAEGGKPAASISWRNRWNSSVTQSTNKNLDGSFTVESRLILPDDVSSENLSCIITHPSWGEGHTEAIQAINHEGKWNWFWIIIPLGLISFIIAILIGLYIMRKHLGKLRNCWKSKIPAPPPPKTPQDVEEVEPYASYVQRINSIYNSSAELCNA
ncbi:cell surface glycoprotein CD200 receptor 1-A-like isoform X2 [Conger conger]|uniref:cell surface glycoprotein CD200 receptor 1-A-like isoform X2 n=1 Tax=Conger conger TaxID=82655 RepID=UPI002A5A1A25|nr:cell surface glycoprotein CD200 receptor 1-A-like isoform X2 [Conger conger]